MEEAGIDPAALEKRMIDLEVKSAYADDLLDQLNRTVFRQQQQIESLARELLALRQQLAAGATPGLDAAADERPPHY
ncbi:SlyX family protein [Castellaniella ginsengisoli]|uniref:SlyX family protein n=1 Tax=Castellaniella ginsengisoli TaxID=546114 RepID=A0AB39D346_9BURK